MSEKEPTPAIRGTQELLLLGEIKGLVQGLRDGQQQQAVTLAELAKKNDQRFDSIDGRLRAVERKAAVAGAISGSAVAVGTALVVEGIKQWVANRGVGQ